MSKPRCTQSGCDGEHTPSVHKLMGEENIGVNLVAEDESEAGEDKDEDEDEGWWVGTVGVMEEPEYPSDDCCADEMAEDGWGSLGSTQPYSVGGGAGIQHPPAKQLPHNELTTAPDDLIWCGRLASRASSGGS